MSAVLAIAAAPAAAADMLLLQQTVLPEADGIGRADGRS